MRKPLRLVPLAMLLVAAVAFPATASASVQPGTYTPTASSFNSADAPGSSHLANGSASPSCTVNADLSISCNSYTLGGVGHTNATLNFVANYTTDFSCTNGGRQLVEAQAQTVPAPGTPLVIPSDKNGNMTVPAESLPAPHTVGQTGSGSPCPNRNWTWTVTSVTLTSFDYTLTFKNFSEPYIEITATDP